MCQLHCLVSPEYFRHLSQRSKSEYLAYRCQYTAIYHAHRRNKESAYYQPYAHGKANVEYRFRCFHDLSVLSAKSIIVK